MAFRIEVLNKVFDARASKRLEKWQHIKGSKKITRLFICDNYLFDMAVPHSRIKEIAALLYNPVTQKTLNNDYPDFDWAIEIGFLPGVTDNVGGTVSEIIRNKFGLQFKAGENVYSSQTTFIKGKLASGTVRKLAENLYNPLIQCSKVKSSIRFKSEGGMGTAAPKVVISRMPPVTRVDLHVSDDELEKLGRLGISDGNTRRGPLALSTFYLKTIRKYFDEENRRPTDVEIESLAQTWSEHCKHTIFTSPLDEIKEGLFAGFIKKATEVIRKKKGGRDNCVSVFNDNSGAIRFDGSNLFSYKVETHNSPCALDPFGGSITGIVGVNRDCLGFGLGAKPVANFYGFCLAQPDENYPLFKDRQLTQPMLSTDRIMEGVIEGINAGGNQSGIPTPLGFIYFDSRFRGKPLVFAGTGGIIPDKIKGRPSHLKKALPGDYIVMAGGRVGKDGIHGATFSSQTLNAGSPSTAVQIGDPITQKKMSDALIKEARDLLLYRSITDNGAGGLSCSVSEMARESGGCLVELDKVPLKYPGLAPWEIWISESQERMTLAVPPSDWKRLKSLLDSRGVEAAVIGRFTASRRCRVRYKGETVMDVSLSFLHDGWPKRPQKSKPPVLRRYPVAQNKFRNLTPSLLNLISRPGIASYSFISMQYDHLVQASSVVPPLVGRGMVNGEAAVFRPVLSSSKGVILAYGLYPSYTEIDPYKMAAAAIDSALRNAVASGASPDGISLLDNFCWCSASDPERLWQLKQAVKACYETAVGYGTPFISGKDSMFNDFSGFNREGRPVKISVPPTLLISSVAVIEDITKSVTFDFKQPGDLIYVLGETHPEMAGSEYYRMQNPVKSGFVPEGEVPAVRTAAFLRLYRLHHRAVLAGLVSSSAALTRGGLAVSLSKCAMAGRLGLDISLDRLPGPQIRAELALFSESQGRLIVTVAPRFGRQFEKLMSEVPAQMVGSVKKEPAFKVSREGKPVINTTVDILLKNYRKTFSGY